MVLELPLDVLAMAPRYLTETPSWVLKRGDCRGVLKSIRVVSWFKDLIKCCFVGSGDLLRWFKVVLVVILG